MPLLLVVWNAAILDTPFKPDREMIGRREEEDKDRSFWELRAHEEV